MKYILVCLAFILSGCVGQAEKSNPITAPSDYRKIGERTCNGCGSMFEVFGRESREVNPTVDNCPNCVLNEEQFDQLIEKLKEQQANE